MSTPLQRPAPDQQAYNYDGRIFRSVQNSANGQVDDATIFYYRQQGNLLSATYSGGAIRYGTMVGLVDAAGRLDFRYQHVSASGEIMTGECRSTPERLPDGRIRLHEKWQWTCKDFSKGESIVEEVEPAATPAPPTNQADNPVTFAAGRPDVQGEYTIRADPPTLETQAERMEGGAARRFRLMEVPGRYAICTLAADAPIPSWVEGEVPGRGFVAISRTPDELSLVCPAGHVPPGVPCEVGWVCLRVQGPLDFDEVGVLVALAGTLAAAGIPIFAISTYRTDYLLLKESALDRAVGALRAAGHQVEPLSPRDNV